MSIINELFTEACNRESGYAVFQNDSVLANTIVKRVVLSVCDGGKSRNVTISLCLTRSISEDECEEFKCILEHNDIPMDRVKQKSGYNYHVYDFPKAWLEDIFPKFLEVVK